MRIRRLDLTAFGPFSDRSLPMEGVPGTLQVLQGRNGAGKSSSLRALSALLFGFPHNTPDAWLHEMRKLRVGALLEDDDGSGLEIVRNKGRKNTLRDPDGAVVPEAELERLLGGMHRELYSTLFALDHQRLREAGEQLVHGGEDLGESLFGAGMGRDVHQLLARLRERAGKLFLPRGQTPLLNAAIKGFKDAHDAANKSQLQPASWHKARADEERLRRQRDEIEGELDELQPRRERLKRLKQVLPLLAGFDELQRQRQELGDGPLLPAEAAEERREVMDRLRRGDATIEQLDKRIAALEEELGQQDSRRDLLLHGAQITALFKRLGAQQEAAAHRVGLQARIDAGRDEARAVLLGEGDERDIDAGQQARLRKLISQHQLLLEQRADSESARELCAARLERNEQQLAELGPVPQPLSLRNAVEALRAAGDLPRRRVESSATTARARATAADLLARLGHWSGTLEEARCLPCPAAETIDRFDVRWLQLEREAALLDDREQTRDQDQDRIRDELAVLEQQGSLPSEDALRGARSRRDAGWRLVQRTWLDDAEIDAEVAAHLKAAENRKPSDRELAADVGESIDAADRAADLLLRSTEQAALLDRLRNEQSELNERQARLERERTALDGARKTLTTEWADEWTPCSITPLSPGEMRPWLERLARLREAIDNLHAAEDAEALLAELIDQHARQLLRGLTDLDAEQAAAGAGQTQPQPATEAQQLAQRDEAEAADDVEQLTRRGELAEAELARIQTAEDEARQLRQRQEQLADDLVQARLAEREANHKLELWQLQWTAAIDGLPLGDGATIDAVEAFLDNHVALAKQVQELRDLQARVEGIDKDRELFEQDTSQLVESCAPELRTVDASTAADVLATRLAQAEAAQAVRDRNDNDLTELRKERDAERTRQEADRVRRDELLAQAGCTTVEELIAAEERSASARRLDQDLAKSRTEVVGVGGASDLGSLRADVAGLDADALPGEIERLTSQINGLRERHDEAAQAMGAQLEVIKGLDQGAAAAEAAELAQNKLATVRQLTLSYARQHLAAQLLEREIQRYRQANQGPLLERAGQLFRRLTDEHFHDLTVAFDDEARPSLLCLRADEREVEPRRLSDGEADQLYLALRIASLERHLERNTALPFVADDLFVSFDDERARAGLAVLAELAQRTQVIFFTHHARLVQIARESLGEERVELLQL